LSTAYYVAQLVVWSAPYLVDLDFVPPAPPLSSPLATIPTSAAEDTNTLANEVAANFSNASGVRGDSERSPPRTHTPPLPEGDVNDAADGMVLSSPQMSSPPPSTISSSPSAGSKGFRRSFGPTDPRSSRTQPPHPSTTIASPTFTTTRVDVQAFFEMEADASDDGGSDETDDSDLDADGNLRALINDDISNLDEDDLGSVDDGAGSSSDSATSSDSSSTSNDASSASLPRVSSGFQDESADEPLDENPGARDACAATIETAPREACHGPRDPWVAEEIPPTWWENHIPVPPNGKCLYHCFVAARDTAAWLRGREREGLLLGGARSAARHRRDVAEADLLRDALVRSLRDDEQDDLADQLLGESSASWPGDEVLSYLAKLVGGRVELVDFEELGSPVRSIGYGNLCVRLGYVLRWST